MKYNPYLNDWAAALPGFTHVHPQAPESTAQGCLEVLYETQEWFKGITGLPAVTTQPLAGAQGELVGLKLFQAYHREHSKTERNIIFIPKSAHGTNFATAATAGFVSRRVNGQQTGIVLLEAGNDGQIDFDDFQHKVDLYGDRLCGVMITNPNTCGIFETRFKAIADIVHQCGGFVYMDGANMNAIAGWLDLDKMGVDAVHNNLHKTWTIPHGGGGPGDAIVAVSERLIDYLPGRQIVKHEDGSFSSKTPSKTIGSIHRHWGNFAHKVRCLAYLRRLGVEGIPKMAGLAVLSAVYLFERLKHIYPTLPQDTQNVARMHEFILTLGESDFEKLKGVGIPSAKAMMHIGKLFLDYGFHAPTVSWPEALGVMIEPTESYTKAELDRFCDAVIEIKKTIETHPDALCSAPHFTPIDRVDDVTANRKIVLAEALDTFPQLHPNRISPDDLAQMDIPEITQKVCEAVGNVEVGAMGC